MQQPVVEEVLYQSWRQHSLYNGKVMRFRPDVTLAFVLPAKVRLWPCLQRKFLVFSAMEMRQSGAIQKHGLACNVGSEALGIQVSDSLLSELPML